MRPTSARLTVSADVLSPEKGSCRFTHQMLRQVAYDTLSRRDRKARHLAVAAHLRAAFPVDSEEVAEVIARHYLDALVETATTADLLALLDRYRPGQLAPCSEPNETWPTPAWPPPTAARAPDWATRPSL